MQETIVIINTYYYPLITALACMFFAQAIKIVRFLIVDKNLKLKQAFVSGGMPSSHSAMVTGLTVAVGLSRGFSSDLFAICVVFSMIVMYDAAGVRRAVGNQAAVLNQIIDDLVASGRFKAQKLQELLGHTQLEVVFGVLLGIVTALVLYP